MGQDTGLHVGSWGHVKWILWYVQVLVVTIMRLTTRGVGDDCQRIVVGIAC